MLNRKIILIFVLIGFLPLPAQILDTIWRYPGLPANLYYIPEGNKLYAIVWIGETGLRPCVFIIDCATLQVRNIIHIDDWDNLHPAVYNPRHNKVYQTLICNVSPPDTMGLAVIDNRSDSVIRYLPIPVMGYCDDAIAVSITSDKVYAVNNGGRITILDCSTDTVVKIIEPTSPRPCYFAIWDSVGNQMYFGCGDWISPDIVTVVNCYTDSVAGLISTGIFQPECACYNHLRRKLYVGSADASGLSIIDCVSNNLIRRIPTPSTQGFFDKTCEYCAEEDKVYWLTVKGIYVIDGKTDTIANFIPAPRNERLFQSLAYAEWSNRLYAFAEIGDSFIVYVLDCHTDSVIGQGTFNGRLPRGALANPIDHKIYVSVYWDSAVYVFRDSLQGIAEEQITLQVSQTSVPTFISNLLLFPESAMGENQKAVLMDVSGRRVLKLKPGVNDVRCLASGVYFIRCQGEKGKTDRVVIIR